MGKDWIKKHKQDKYYRKSQKEGMRSRAVYKIKQIQEKYKVFNDAQLVLDLCCAPGSWIEEIKKEFDAISVIGVDLVKISPVEGVIFIQGDIRDDSIIDVLSKDILGDVDVVISDCAPKFTGSKETDYARQIFLVERVIYIAHHFLEENGHLVCKLFDGDHTIKLRNQLKKEFDEVHLFKPEASRKKSPELYLIAKFYKK